MWVSGSRSYRRWPLWGAWLVAMLIQHTLSASTHATAAEAAIGTNPGPSMEGVLRLATESYESGSYEMALTYYHQLLQSGADNGLLYYNIANCYFRLAQPGRAVLNYRRALLDLPRDRELQANLALARQSLPNRATSELTSGTKFLDLLVAHGDLFNDYELKLGVFWIYTAAWLCLLLAVVTRSSMFRLGLGVSVVGLIFWCLPLLVGTIEREGQTVFSISKSLKPAVVVSKETKVFAGNSDNFQVTFVLHEGDEVLVGELREEWLELVFDKNRRGWVKADQIETI